MEFTEIIDQIAGADSWSMPIEEVHAHLEAEGIDTSVAFEKVKHALRVRKAVDEIEGALVTKDDELSTKELFDIISRHFPSDRLAKAMDLLEQASEWIELTALSADRLAKWHRAHLELTGEHWHLTEEGWVPASMNTRQATGYDPVEVLDEVNAPAVSPA